MQNAISWFAAKPKWFRVSTYLVLVYFTYALLLGVLAPAILKTKLPQIVEEQTGRKASVADIAINPFLLKVDVRNFTIYASAHSGVLSEARLRKKLPIHCPITVFQRGAYVIRRRFLAFSIYANASS